MTTFDSGSPGVASHVPRAVRKEMLVPLLSLPLQWGALLDLRANVRSYP